MDIRKMMMDPAGLLVQGITGRQGRMEVEWMLNSGTKITAGVTPGRGGESVHGVPVYNSVSEAVRTHRNVVSMSYVPRGAASDAAIEAVEAGIRLNVMSAENVPLHRLVAAIAAAERARAILVGPNSQGIMIPDVGRIGCPGGVDPERRFSAGPVGVVSRSGGMASEISLLLRQWGWGTSVQLSLGGSPLTGLRLDEAAQLVQADKRTRVLVVFGEPSGDQEFALAARVRKAALPINVVAMIPGVVADAFPADLPFGHAPRAGADGVGTTTESKIEALSVAGIPVARSFNDLRKTLSGWLAPGGTLNG